MLRSRAFLRQPWRDACGPTRKPSTWVTSLVLGLLLGLRFPTGSARGQEFGVQGEPAPVPGDPPFANNSNDDARPALNERSGLVRSRRQRRDQRVL